MRKYLKEMREINNLTQLEVSKKLDISESYYCLIENGERQKELSLALANNLANVFGVSVEWIIEQEKKTA